MIPPRVRWTAALLALPLALAATSCAPQEPEPSAQPTPSATAPVIAEPEPEQSVEPGADAEVDPTCETIIATSIVTEFERIGWTSREEPFYVGATELEDGLRCMWADFDAPASDNLQIFGWSPIDEQTTRSAQTELVGQGWIREEAAEGVYVTENPETIIAPDENGYGITYLFGDGWVTVADTKQGLVLIEWPPPAS
ncbi:hypothetical protein [Microbacterium aurantiacum]|uniref:Nitrate ABC transporter substrate-binding protein n=1 Tax=Microbacterium aurantiacum TaxID=162393 RepID=A0ABT8FRA6_9MICO|nr:hypothetical protein [Microbacterium aurantiacum]MDN4463854.1 hypothetical protein [Microbacterium aurantiacum]